MKLDVIGQVAGLNYDADGSGHLHVNLSKDEPIPEDERTEGGPRRRIVQQGSVRLHLIDEEKSATLIAVRKKRVRVTLEVLEDEAPA